MRYLNKIARLLKLKAAAPDLELQVYRNSGDFSSALKLWADHFVQDLDRLVQMFDKLPISAKIVPLEDVRLRKEHSDFLRSAEGFAKRADLVLARRCLQYSELAESFLQPLALEDRKIKEASALSYLSVLDRVLGMVARLAGRYLEGARKYSLADLEPSLFSYLESLEKLDRPSLIEALKRGEVPFRVT